MADVIELQDDDDASFLELVAAAEAQACFAKRQKVSTSASSVVHRPEAEGSYMAALKGSRSSMWQQQQQETRLSQRKSSGGGGSTMVGSKASSTISSIGGTCFKCGMAGHWARDCAAAAGKENAGGFASGRASSLGEDGGEVPEKGCPCGSGSCLVLTSNTPKNPGRKFYRCPLKEESGGCNFFEWCDSSSKNLPATRTSHYESNPSVPNHSCPCGAGSCLVLVTKNGKNVGRQFYRCPAKEGSGYCGFFKWCDDQDSASGRPTFTANKIENLNYSGSQAYGETRGSSCFKCGQEGHWSRDCPMQSSEGYPGTRGNRPSSSAPGTCFKCGGTGHWARDCTANNLAVGTGAFQAAKTSRTAKAYNSR